MPWRGQSRCVTATLRDISERKRSDNELRHALDSLREGDRRKDEFIATLGHELRNPLAPVRNAANLLAMGAAPEQAAWAAQVIQRQVGHMARLLDDLLDAARITQGKLELRRQGCALSEIVAFALEVAKPFLDKGEHALSVAMPREDVTLNADPARLSQVLANLLHNAAKYSPSGSRIELRASIDDGSALIEVCDQGIGFDPARAEELFGMFHQAPEAQGRDQGGLGIGLALARGIVQLHGGTLAASSAGRGRGSCFKVTLPNP